MLCGIGTAMGDDLPRADPADHQVDPVALAAAMDAADQLGFVRGVVVARDGAVIGEDHFGATGTGFRQSHSITKSVTSMLIGIAIEQGLIPEGVGARMVDYLPDHLVPDDPAMEGVLIFHLLNMTGGFDWDEDTEIIDWQTSPDPVSYLLDRPLTAAPGTRFEYNTASSHLLSVMLTEATGMSTVEYADQVLFGPLGITNRHWTVIGGYNNGGNSLYMRTEALAKLGVMVLDGGSWEGEQIVPAWWLNRSTIADILGVGRFGPLTQIQYGWLWWLDRGTDYNLFTAWGWAGQYIFCVPALNLVVAVHSQSNPDGSIADQQEAAVLDIIVNQILPATTDRRRLTATGLDVPELAAVDDLMRDMMDEHDIRHVTAAITKDGRLVYARGFTWDEADVEPIEPTALFRIGSIGKAIASLATHRLIDDGALTHETEVQPILGIEALPGESVDPLFDEVTVDNLLTHTGGMYSDDNIYTVSDAVASATGEGPPCTQNEILSYIMSHPFIFDPGTSWDYNNYGYMMLDRLVDSMTGRHFADFVNEEFFHRVGVGRARIAHQLESEAYPTEVDYDGLEGDPYSPPLESSIAAGGWVMTAPDLARLWSVVFDEPDAGGLLDPTTREAMFEAPFAVSEQLEYYRGWFGEQFIDGMNVSLGWLSDPDDEFVLRGHSGGGSGIANHAFWHSDNIVLVVFSNKDPIADDFLFPEITTWPDHDLWSSVGVSSSPVGAAPTESWIPVVASADGVGSSVWRSDIGLLNRSEMTNHVRLRLYQDGEPHDHELELAPSAYRTITDVLALYELQGSGPLRVFSSEALSTTSRTYDQAAAGTFGQFLGSESPTKGLDAGESAVLMQLREDPAFRSNIGLMNGWKRAAEIEIDLFDGDGSPVTTVSRTVPPETTVQLGRPFFELGGRSDILSGYAVVRVLEGQHILAYASVVDNATNDPTTIPMKTDVGSPRSWVAAAAHADGAHDSLWRTDTTLLNLSGTAATAELRFRGDETANAMVVVADGEQRLVEDVVATLGASGSGSLEVVVDQPVMVGSRTYNLSDTGTFGQFLDGLPVARLATDGDTVWLPQLRQDDLFRTNIGVVNGGEIEAVVRIRLYDDEGTRLAAPTRTLAPYARLQLNEPFRTIAGRTDLEAAYATVTVESGEGITAYASVIDNATNDPTTVPMVY
jgi:CubicO group peptidase (beta-lactamase class C family)